MTDEERAEEYATKITDELENRGILTPGESDQRYVGIMQGVLYGLTEGRKELEKGLAEGGKERNCVNCSNHGKQFEVMKLKAQIEYMKCCENCKHDFECDGIELCDKWVLA